MANYVFKGSEARDIGRFGTVQPGQTLDMDKREADAIQALIDNEGSVEWQRGPEPSYTRQQMVKSTSYQVEAGDDNKTIIVQNTEPATITLPAEPELGFSIEVICGPQSAAAVTVDPGDNDVVPEVLSLAMGGISRQLYIWLGSQVEYWKAR
jgi:hypothetical protein